MAMSTLNSELLIDYVYGEEDLWNNRSPGYCNRLASKQKWDDIANKLNITAEVAKTKWRSFRDVFRRERLKILEAEKNGDGNYKKWQYYDRLMFLNDIIVPKTGRGSYKNTKKSPIIKTENEDPFNYNNDQKSNHNDKELSDLSDESSTSSMMELAETSIPIVEYSEDESPPKKSKRNSNKFATFGNYVAEELERLPSITALYCKRMINDALFEAALHTNNSSDRRQSSSTNRTTSKDMAKHMPKLLEGTEITPSLCRRCYVCANSSKFTKKRRMSRYMCSECNVTLCVVPCFAVYHTPGNF